MAAFEELVIPGRRAGEKFVGLVTNVLSGAECREWIEFAEAKGFSPASLLADQKTKNPHRSNDRTLLFDAARSDLLFERLRPFLPTSFENGKWALYGLNDRLSFLRYVTDERYGKHVDVPYESGGRRSFVTVQLYLNEGFEGGCTRFDQEVGFKRIEDRKFLDVVPKTGAALVFEHELTHEGTSVQKGVKYTVRVDVMYEPVQVATSSTQPVAPLPSVPRPNQQDPASLEHLARDVLPRAVGEPR